MKVLLINPNRYMFPPVPPIGLEHVAARVEEGGHEVKLLDLCFSEKPFRDLDATLKAFSPDIAGITVRNIDTVLYHTNEFFLDDIRRIVGHIKDVSGIPVIAGGTGLSVNPDGVVDFLGVDHGIVGPAEDVINDLLNSLAKGERPPKILHRRYRYDISCPRSRCGIDYAAYFERGGIAGFETHKGCGSSCVYCLEANTNVSFKAVPDVIAEIRDLAGAGFRRFHLCDPEFNEDLDYCLDFCTALAGSGLNIDWALYLKPANYNKKLFRLMRESGVSLVTMTVDSWKKCSLYYSDIEKIIFMAKSAGLKIVVDFLCGFPYEDDETLVFFLDMFRRLRPDSVGVNAYIRLYKTLQITRTILSDPSLRCHVTGNIDDVSLIRPVFYNHLSDEKLTNLIGGNGLFRIEGPEKGVNYGRD